MRRFSKYVALVALVVGFVAAPVAAGATPTSTTWNNGRTVQYGATPIKPPNGDAHRVSVSDADFYSLTRVGDAETYGVDALNYDSTVVSALTAAGGTRHSVGTTFSHAVGSNANGTIWDVTVYAYAKTSPGHGVACKAEYTITPLGIFEGGYSVQATQVTAASCDNY